MRINSAGNFVLRGVAIEDAGAKEINLFDGTYKAGFRLVDFQIAPETREQGGECAGLISTQGTQSADTWNWEDQTQVGWSSMHVIKEETRQTTFSLVDGSMVLVDSIYVNVTNDRGTTKPVNYYIEVEPVDLKEFEYAMAYIQGESQG